MADTEQTKVCPLCAETIKAAAKVCPNCRKSQRRWVFLTRYDITAIVLLVLLLGVYFLVTKVLYQKRDFALDREKIQVSDFHFAANIHQYKNHFSTTNFAVVGILTNRSDHLWSIGEFKIRYFNKEGKIAGLDDPISDAFVVLPHSDHSFRLDLYNLKSMPGFATCKIEVVSAEDPKTPFKLFNN